MLWIVTTVCKSLKWINLYARVRDCEIDRERLKIVSERLKIASQIKDDKIAAMEARLDMMERLNEIGTIEVGPDGRLYKANENFADMSGYSVEELERMPLYELLPFVLRRRHNESWVKLIAGGVKAPPLIAGELRRKDGTPLPVMVTTCEVQTCTDGPHYRADLRRR